MNSRGKPVASWASRRLAMAAQTLGRNQCRWVRPGLQIRLVASLLQGK
ncbi:hypothetical protein PpBr36_00390 [Pyricularia pennisetigena]|nr:hypothetical protein PpBr36_00390 [Pyricularia pennisetigena]TLS29564.1 hypothetical protein PpBr36_00390 [Pyricularia pennisetigena]